MNVEIGTEAPIFLFWEYIFVSKFRCFVFAVCLSQWDLKHKCSAPQRMTGRLTARRPVRQSYIGKSYVKGSLTRDFRLQGFLHESVSPRPPSIPLEPFWIFSTIRGDIRELMFITGVNNTGDKLLSGVNDTGKKFIAGVVDTGEQFIFPRCRWYRSEKNQKAENLSPVSTTKNFIPTPLIRESLQY